MELKEIKSVGWSRKAAGCALIVSFLGTFLWGQEKASAEQTIMELDTFFNSVSNRSELDEGRSLVVNGQPLDLAIFRIPAAPKESMARLETWCSSSDQSPFDPSKIYHSTEEQSLPLNWVSSSNLEQSIGCLKTNAKNTVELIKRLDKALEFDDLSYLGDFYFFKLNASSDGTRAVSIRNGEGFDIKQIFKSEGDVPGRDLPDLKRPFESRRIYAFGERNEAGATLIYENETLKPTEVYAGYKKQFQEKGYDILSNTTDNQGKTEVLAERNNKLFALVVWKSKNKTYSAVSVVSSEETI